MKGLYAVAISLLLLATLVHGTALQFQSSLFVRTEKRTSTGETLRTMPQNGTFAYDATTGRERWQLGIPFNGRLLQEIRIWEELYLRYTLCDNKCGFEDKFVTTNDFPIMYAASTFPYFGSETEFNGIPASNIRTTSSTPITQGTSVTQSMFFQTDIYGQECPVRITIDDTATDTTTVFDFFNCTSGGVNITDVPDGCTAVDPGCYRIDIWFGLDYSGSVGSGITDAKTFVTSFAEEVAMAEDRVRIGVGRYDYKPHKMCSITPSYSELQSCVGNDTRNADGFTGTAHTIAMGLVEFNADGRKSARKVQFIVTDGFYNRPCSSTSYEWNSGNPSYCNCNEGNCVLACSNCDWRTCCVTSSGNTIQEIYDDIFPLYPDSASVQYAIGVGPGIGATQLNLIAQGESSRAFTVADYSALNSVIDSLVSALACEIPPTALCPNDCLPGGFCCGQSCECLTDCSTLDNDCQQASCQVTQTSTSCVYTDPDDSFCTATAQCTDGSCINAIGCVYTVKNSTCDDGNQCTVNDTCTVSGCLGVPAVNQSCNTGVNCKEGICSSLGTCDQFDKQCDDPDTTDCVFFYCDSSTGNCASETVQEGFKCRADDPSEPCTVYLCAAGDCVPATRDSSECQDDEGVSAGAVAGSVAGGLAIVAIAALAVLALLAAACVVLLIIAAIAAVVIIAALIATAGVGVQTTALATAVEGNMDVQVNPGHIEAATEAVSPLFED